MIKTMIKTETYALDNGFFLDVVDKMEEYDAYIYHEDYGTKSCVLSSSKDVVDLDKYMEIVEGVLDNAIAQYKAEVMAEPDHSHTFTVGLADGTLETVHADSLMDVAKMFNEKGVDPDYIKEKTA